MSRRVGVVSVDFEAGTAKFNSQVNAAKANMIEFGKHGVSNVQATSAALRVMEGNMTNNLRAAEKFLATLPGVGAAMRAAFPIVGAVAFLGVIGEMGKRMGEFVKNVQEAPAKFNAAFGSMSSAIRMSNDELSLVNAKLEADIAKLEGKRQSNLSIALLEAKVSAEKLGETLDSDLEKVKRLLEDGPSAGFLEHAWASLNGTSDKGLREELFGKTGSGGFRGQVRSITAAGGPDMNQKLADAYKQMLAQLDKEIAAAQTAGGPLPPAYARRSRAAGGSIAPGGKDVAELLEELTGARSTLSLQSAAIPLRAQNEALTSKRDILTANKANDGEDRLFEDRLKALDAQLDGVQAKLKAIGAPESVQVAAKAFSEAQKAIEEVNKAIEEVNKALDLQHTKLTAAQEGQIRAKELAIASAEADAEWKSKLTASTTSINDRVKSYEMLTAAIGKGYEATKAASVETQLMQHFGANYADPSRSGDIAAQRSLFNSEADAQHGNQVAESIDKLQDQITLERDLAAVQAQGAEAVRGVTLAHRLADIARSNDAVSAKKLMAAEMELYANERQNATAAEVAKINQKIEATDRLTAATLKGADAIRQANLENRITDILREHKGPTQAALSEIGAAKREDASTHGQAVAGAAASLDRIQAINDQIELLKENKTKTVDIDIKLRDLENQKLQAITNQMLAQGGVKNGFDAFLVDMQRNGQQASQQFAKSLYDALHQTVEGVSDELSKMVTGDYHKGDAGKMFKGVGQGLLKSTFSTIIGAGIGKADGSQGNPLWVRNADQAGGKGVAGLLGKLGRQGSSSDSDDSDSGDDSSSGSSGLFGKIGGWLGNLFHKGDGHASGGPVDPGTIYPVGEQGIEWFAPKVPGTIIPSGGLGGGDLHVHVDARGGDVGTAAQVVHAIQSSSVAHTLRAHAEQMRRTPRKG